MARLVAGWILAFEPEAEGRVAILKGESVRGTTKSHEIVLVRDRCHVLYVIDPTMWQFFPEAKSILILVTDSLANALKQLGRTYGGRWSVSEHITSASRDAMERHAAVIERNIRLNIRLDQTARRAPTSKCRQRVQSAAGASHNT